MKVALILNIKYMVFCNERDLGVTEAVNGLVKDRGKKSRIRETLNLLIDAGSSTDTTLE